MLSLFLNGCALRRWVSTFLKTDVQVTIKCYTLWIGNRSDLWWWWLFSLEGRVIQRLMVVRIWELSNTCNDKLLPAQICGWMQISCKKSNVYFLKAFY
jgi:hypothetical protein